VYVTSLLCMRCKIKEVINCRGNTLVICQNGKMKGVAYT
jgi:hypothetical protein